MFKVDDGPGQGWGEAGQSLQEEISDRKLGIPSDIGQNKTELRNIYNGDSEGNI